MIVYKTYAQALRRVEQLKGVGIWPAIIRHLPEHDQGGWRLSYDPPFTMSELTSYGYVDG